MAHGRVGFVGGHGVGYGHAQRFGYALAVSRIAGVAVADVAVFDEIQRIAHCGGGVVEQGSFLLGAHQMEERARLAEIVGVVQAIVPMGGITVDFEWRLGILRLLLPLADFIRLVLFFL